ncbi:MAG: glycosyltransferase [Chitinophagaceae bacterium]|nr:glycosyltransferase [Chitinophagaceae bacterium]
MERTLSLDKTLTPVLFIAYQFPPRGGPGVHRSVNFVRYLSQYGFNPIVLTVRKEDYKNADEQTDESLLATIPENIRVIRTKSYQPLTFINRMNQLRIFRLFWYFLYPIFWERTARWPFKVTKIAEEEIKANNIPIVYTSSGPFSTLFLGRRLKRRQNVCWVADLRDPFTDAYAWHFPSKLHWLLARRVEKRILAKADIIIVNTPEVKKLFLQRGIGTENRIQVITNGY